MVEKMEEVFAEDPEWFGRREATEAVPMIFSQQEAVNQALKFEGLGDHWRLRRRVRESWGEEEREERRAQL